MSNAIKIFNRILTKEFYLRNAGLFLIGIALSFGFMSGIEHMALAEFFISSTPTLLIPVCIWLLYLLKLIRFNSETVRAHANEFIYNSRQFDRSMLLLLTISVIVNESLPVLAYAAFLIVMAFKYKQIQIIVLIFLFIIVFITAAAASLIYSLHHPNREKKENRLVQWFAGKWYRPYTLFFPEWMFRNAFLMFTGSKLFSCLTLAGVTALYQHDIYDSRLMAMGIIIGMSANMVIIFRYQQFEEQEFSLLRNLPISKIRRLTTFFLFILIANAIEFGIVARNFPACLSGTDLVSLIFFMMTIPVSIYGFMYTKKYPPDWMVLYGFIFCMAIIVVILFKVHALALSIALLTTGISHFARNYYRFEFNTNAISK